MLIGVTKRFVFIANSKAGSTSIESVLSEHAEIRLSGSPQQKHMAWRNVRKKYASLFDQPDCAPETFFRFGVVRDPVEWALSWYTYRRSRKKGGIPAGTTFEAFWKTPDWIKNKSQRAHFVDEDGVCRFDLILPLEALGDTFPVLSRALGVNHGIVPVKNRSKEGLPRSDIPEQLIREINEHYRDDLVFYKEWKTRHGEALRQALPKIARAPRMNVNEIAEPPGASLVVSDLSSRTVQRARLAPLPAQVAPGRPLKISGVVIPRREYESEALRLIVADERGEREVSWGLPSPRLGGKFPDSARSAHARFREEVLVNNGRPVELFLDEGGGRRHILFRLELMSRS
jgi:hypothetical protein